MIFLLAACTQPTVPQEEVVNKWWKLVGHEIDAWVYFVPPDEVWYNPSTPYYPPADNRDGGAYILQGNDLTLDMSPGLQNETMSPWEVVTFTLEKRVHTECYTVRLQSYFVANTCPYNGPFN